MILAVILIVVLALVIVYIWNEKRKQRRRRSLETTMDEVRAGVIGNNQNLTMAMAVNMEREDDN